MIIAFIFHTAGCPLRKLLRLSALMFAIGRKSRGF